MHGKVLRKLPGNYVRNSAFGFLKHSLVCKAYLKMERRWKQRSLCLWYLCLEKEW